MGPAASSWHNASEQTAGQPELLTTPTGELIIVKSNPCLTRLSRGGEIVWAVHSPIGDFRGQAKTFSVSADGATVDFDFDGSGIVSAAVRFARYKAV